MDWYFVCLQLRRFLHWCQSKRWLHLILGIGVCALVILCNLTSEAMGQRYSTRSIASLHPSLEEAQLLNEQGHQAFTQGQPQAALQYWQEAETLYQETKDTLGVFGSQLNQAKALQILGFYRRANSLLLQLQEAMGPNPPSPLKVNIWFAYGQSLRLLGNLSDSQVYLEQGLVMAQELNDQQYQQAAYVYLGNTFAAQEQWTAAANQYEQAIALPGPLTLTAQLRQLQTLPHRNRTIEVVSQTQAFLQQLSQASSLTLQTQGYLVLDLIHWLLQSSPDTLTQVSPSPDTLLHQVIQQANDRGDRRTQSYGWGYLGQWYESQQQWLRASQSTQLALSLANDLSASELEYLWQWQQGRIARSQGKVKKAIAHYTTAVDTLQSLRQDIVAVTRNIQFSFRDQVEPIYRDLVQLLLSPASLADNSQAALEQARQVIENLQVAELNNFFREPCIEAISQSLDTIDPTAALIYPIILPDQLALIVSIPGQPLHYYATALSQANIESGIQEMLNAMRLTAFTSEQLTTAQQLYQWLVKPAESLLQANGIQTLTFVLDGPLRRVPIAALHNGIHYLVEDYRLAISPGLKLLNLSQAPTAFSEQQALLGGLSIAGPNRSPLLGVEQEIAHVEQLIDAEVLLNEAFTTDAVLDQARRQSFNILHLATHAQFGETDADTFIETWDGTLQINQIRQIMQQQDIRGLPPDLLVLSACDTAQGNDQAVLGMAGLAVRSGSQSTMATLWSVNDQATATFIQHFYNGLLQKEFTKAAAIQYAQAQMLQTDTFNHPYYWAPFVLVGNWL